MMENRFLKCVLGVSAALLVMAQTGVAQAYPTIDTAAKQAIVADVETDTVLFSKNGFDKMYPASMTKMMTTHILFNQLKSGKLTMDSTFPVSEKAWKKGGSKMYVKVNTEAKISDLLRGIIVQSGNDACIVVAEGIAGTEEAFADLMNQEAKDIGLTHSHFKNSTGWPDEEHVMSPHDLYLLAKSTIKDFPEYYPLYAEGEFTYSGIRQPNRNLLLGENGVDGLKTGHTEASGYGITISGVDEATGRRVIVVVNGLGSEKERAQEAKKLLLWGYRSFENTTVLNEGQEVLEAKTWFGETPRVKLLATKDVKLTLPKGAGDDVKITATYAEPLQAPIAKGAEVGTLKIEVSGQDPISVPLVAGADVAKLSGVSKIMPALRHYIFGKAQQAAAE